MAEKRRVLLDTDVWSHLFVAPRRRDPRVPHWRELLLGASVAISAQTRAEVLAGIMIGGWREERAQSARQQLDATVTVPLDGAVIERYAELKAECARIGHALHDKQHTADRWIAASAAAHDLPLLSGDGIFRGVPGLRLLEDRIL